MHLGETDESISAEGALLREDQYFVLNRVIFLIFTLKRDLHWGGEKLSLGGGVQKERLGSFRFTIVSLRK